jgi:hypothetical protein
LKPTPNYNYYWWPSLNIILHSGNEVEVVGEIVDKALYQLETPEGRLLILKTDVELIDADAGQRHKCHCPPENFKLNGRGCTCGGV